MNEIEEIEIREAGKAIRFWVKEYDGCYPPAFHHPVEDMIKVGRGWKILLSEVERRDNKIKVLEGLRMFLREQITDLESDLKLNASISDIYHRYVRYLPQSSPLAKQCDAARDAETRVKELEGAIEELLCNFGDCLPRHVCGGLREVLKK